MGDTLWYLKSCDLFQRLTDMEAARLERCAFVRTYDRKCLVYSPTEPGESLMLLATGRIKIKDVTPDGRETIAAFIEQGEVFGELAILDAGPRLNYAETLEKSRVVAIPRDAIVELLATRADLALSVTKLIGLRRQRVECRLRNLLFLSSRDRLLRTLLELADSHGDRLGRRVEIRIPLSHQDIAGLIGVARETVTLCLGQLQIEGLVTACRRRLIIEDYPRLHAAAYGGDPAISTHL